MSPDVLSCLDCFHNHGFRQVLKPLSRVMGGKCPQCGSVEQRKIDAEGLKQALLEFFVTGSYIAGTYAPVYKVAEGDIDPAPFDPTLASDADLAHRLTGLTVFYNAPPLWRLGITRQYHEFEAGGERRWKVAERLVKAAQSVTVPEGAHLFRIRLNLKANEPITSSATFDPPPPTLQRVPGRWDNLDFPVLYVSDDIELCMHECRTTISDEIVVATIAPIRQLRLLDLTGHIPWDGKTDFDDPDVFVGIMCRSRGEWLDFCREIARAARVAGYDGIKYVSYYAQAKHALQSRNLALFGRPIGDGMLRIASVNRLRISDMTYKYQFGPVLFDRRTQ